jgi:DNA-binding GntR family transcriptional regulator
MSATQIAYEDIPASSTDAVVRQVVNGILSGIYVPGQRLTEMHLTNLLRVSRPSVREAFRLLEATGIVVQPKHRGACVRALSRREAIDLMIVTEPVVRLIARLAANRFSVRPRPAGLAAFSRQLRLFREDGDQDAREVLNRRRNFYDLLIEVTGNTQLASVFPTMRVHLLRVQCSPYANEADRLEHRLGYALIVNSVMSGDAKAAEKAIVKHNHQMRRWLEKMPDAAFRVDEET